MDKRTYDLHDLASLLGVCSKTARRYYKAGALPPTLGLPGSPRWSAAVVDKWLGEAKQTETQSETLSYRQRMQKANQ